MKRQTLIQEIASRIQQYKNCVESNNTEWRDKTADRLDELQNELPSGSGIDCGTEIDIDRSKPDCVVLTLSFHHMHESGMYDGWTDHIIRVRPSFDGIDLTISGSNRNDIKEYLHQVYYWCLQTPQQPCGMYVDDDLYQRYIDESESRVAELHAAY